MSYQIPYTFSSTLVALVIAVGGIVTFLTTSLLMWLGSFVGLDEMDSYIYWLIGAVPGFIVAVKVIDSEVQGLLDKWG